MGCAGSKPEADRFVNASKHGKSKDPTVKVEEQLPDFACTSHYKVLKMLGEGGSGETWLCREVATGAEVAVKYIPRPIPKVVLPMIFHEVKIQAMLGEGHVNLVQAREVVLSKSHLGLAMEYVAGGNLTAYVMDKFDSTGIRNGLYMTEPEAQYFFKQFLNAVEYLHANHVAHRDIKLDNIVLDKSNPPRIKLCDFGFAKNWAEESNMFTQIGTPVYMSPQVISSKNSNKGYDATKADVWACGVLLFVMLLGMFPFDHSEHPDPNSSDAHIEVWLQQIKGSWRENPRVAEEARKLSNNCCDLLDKIFELDEPKRIDIHGIRAHPWFNTPLPAVFQKALEDLERDQNTIEERLRNASQELHNKHRDALLQKIVDRSGVHWEAGVDPDTVARVWLGRIKPQHSSSHHGIQMEMVEECDENESMDGSMRRPKKSLTTGTELTVGGISTDGGGSGVLPASAAPQQQPSLPPPPAEAQGPAAATAPADQAQEQQQAQQQPQQIEAAAVEEEAGRRRDGATNGHAAAAVGGNGHQQNGVDHALSKQQQQQQQVLASQLQVPTIIGPAPAAEATTVAS